MKQFNYIFSPVLREVPEIFILTSFQGLSRFRRQCFLRNSLVRVVYFFLVVSFVKFKQNGGRVSAPFREVPVWNIGIPIDKSEATCFPKFFSAKSTTKPLWVSWLLEKSIVKVWWVFTAFFWKILSFRIIFYGRREKFSSQLIFSWKKASVGSIIGTWNFYSVDFQNS